jgi:hypothetical protein
MSKKLVYVYGNLKIQCKDNTNETIDKLDNYRNEDINIAKNNENKNINVIEDIDNKNELFDLSLNTVIIF